MNPIFYFSADGKNFPFRTVARTGPTEFAPAMASSIEDAKRVVTESYANDKIHVDRIEAVPWPDANGTAVILRVFTAGDDAPQLLTFNPVGATCQK